MDYELNDEATRHGGLPMGYKLNEIGDFLAANSRRKRVGRGPGSGRGKTAGRGMNGQKSRSGVALNGFEGGQMPLYQRLPKRGFNNPGRKRLAETNLGMVQAFIDAGRIDPSSIIDEAVLVAAGLVRRRHDGVKILGNGELRTKIELAVSAASKSAVAAVAAKGGSIKIGAESG